MTIILIHNQGPVPIVSGPNDNHSSTESGTRSLTIILILNQGQGIYDKDSNAESKTRYI